jgi:hypothetical protein
MNHLLAITMFMKRPEFGVHAENTAAMDWFVIANLGFLFLMFGFFAGCAWMIWRRSTKPEPHVKLLMELEEDEAQKPDAKANSAREESAPWERPADWWQK